MKLVNEFERYALAQAYNVPVLWYQRIVVNNKKVKGWELPPITSAVRRLSMSGLINRTGCGSIRWGRNGPLPKARSARER